MVSTAKGSKESPLMGRIDVGFVVGEGDGVTKNDAGFRGRIGL